MNNKKEGDDQMPTFEEMLTDIAPEAKYTRKIVQGEAISMLDEVFTDSDWKDFIKENKQKDKKENANRHTKRDN